MDFREMVANDVRKVLLNPAELAQEHLIEGRAILLVEEQEAEKSKRSESIRQDIWMFENALRTIFVSEEARLQAGLTEFRAGQKLLYDERPMNVVEAYMINGLWKVMMETTTGNGGS